MEVIKMELAERFKIVPVANNADYNADYTCDSINMKNYHRATFLVQIHTMGGAALYIRVYSGAANAGLDSQLTFRYAIGGAAITVASCDVLAAQSTSSALALTHATYSNYLVIIEVDAADMDVANQEEWLTMQLLDTATGATGNATVTAILEPRYTQNRSASALT